MAAWELGGDSLSGSQPAVRITVFMSRYRFARRGCDCRRL
jgi:hypothetical protein